MELEKQKIIYDKRKKMIREIENIIDKYVSEILILGKGITFQELLDSMIPHAGYELGSCIDKQVKELIENKALKSRL